MKQTWAIVFLCACAILAPHHHEEAGAVQTARPPNVLLIQADDLGYGDLSAYGQARFQTPALDRLAREGIRFTQVLRRQDRVRSVANDAHDGPAHRTRLDSR